MTSVPTLVFGVDAEEKYSIDNQRLLASQIDNQAISAVDAFFDQSPQMKWLSDLITR